MTRGRHSVPQHFIMSTALLSRARIGGANNGTRTAHETVYHSINGIIGNVNTIWQKNKNNIQIL